MFTDLDLEELIDAAVTESENSPTEVASKQVVMSIEQLQYFVRLAVKKLANQEPVGYLWAEGGKNPDTQEGPGDYFEDLVFDTGKPIEGTPYQEVFLGPSPSKIWPDLEKPAMVGIDRFDAGLSSKLVVEAAERLYIEDIEKQVEIERITTKLSKFSKSMNQPPPIEPEHNWIEP